MTRPDPRADADLEQAARRANTFPWPPLLFAAAIASAWSAGRVWPLAWPGIDDMPARAIGLAFGVAGAALVLWSAVSLRRADTTILPHGTSSSLVTNGPYARFRNPIYLGEVLMLFGVAELTHNVWFVIAALVFAVAVTALQIVPEERHLAALFGAEYDAYRVRTRRWI